MTRFVIYNNNNLQTDAQKYVSFSSPTSGLLGEDSQLIPDNFSYLYLEI